MTTSAPAAIAVEVGEPASRGHVDLAGEDALRGQVAEALHQAVHEHVAHGDEFHVRVGLERLGCGPGPPAAAPDEADAEGVAARGECAGGQERNGGGGRLEEGAACVGHWQTSWKAGGGREGPSDWYCAPGGGCCHRYFPSSDTYNCGGTPSTREHDMGHPESATYFLGGHDLEMVTLRDLLLSTGAEVVDGGLRWGASASAYRAEIEAALAAGREAVLVELADDLPADFPRDRLVWIDHHGPRTNLPTAIEQVFARLGLPAERWTRDFELVAANDRGHLAALERVGATLDEMRSIREFP
jgi:hypothetical protein